MCNLFVDIIMAFNRGLCWKRRLEINTTSARCLLWFTPRWKANQSHIFNLSRCVNTTSLFKTLFVYTVYHRIYSCKLCIHLCRNTFLKHFKFILYNKQIGLSQKSQHNIKSLFIAIFGSYWRRARGNMQNCKFYLPWTLKKK